MSEFEKLMDGDTQRKEVRQRQVDRKQIRMMLLCSLGITFILSFIPPHLGVLLFVLILIIAVFYFLREWIC